MSNLLKEMKQSSPVKALLKEFANNPNWRLDVESFRKEVVNAHVHRPIKSLDLRKARQLEKVIDANLKDQGTRSRLVEIMITCRKVHNEITRQLDSVREMLMLRYRSSMGVYRSREDRVKLINYGLFKEVNKYLTELEQLEDNILLIVEDIDKAGYTLQRLVNMLNLTVDRNAKERSL